MDVIATVEEDPHLAVDKTRFGGVEDYVLEAPR
jgi:hypothetical protein